MIQRAATSANGLMMEVAPPFPITVSGHAAVDGTAISGWPPALDWNLILDAQTNSGSISREESRPSSSSAIMELRRLTGFSWDQLARLFGVNRRSLHFWASGQPLSAGNEERLQRLLATVRKIDRGTASENRLLLLSPLPDETMPFDLLIAGKYEEVVNQFGPGPLRARPRPGPLSAQVAALRRPPKPHELVGALQDPVHLKEGRLLSAIPVNTEREK